MKYIRLTHNRESYLCPSTCFISGTTERIILEFATGGLR